jgi:hypothetical protein
VVTNDFAGYEACRNSFGRNDITTLETGNSSIFYPSASVAFIPTDAFASLHGNNTLDPSNYLKVSMRLDAATRPC